MSFWNFLGEVAMFNMICNLFSGKSKSGVTSSCQSRHGYIYDAEYEARVGELEHEIRESKKRITEYQRIIDNSPSFDIDDCDIDELQDRIDELESRLDDCEVMSDCYDYIQDEMDILQDRLDAMQELDDMYDDIPLYNDYDDIDRDDDW
ncbi:hypothetical protein [Muribaculum intestinale]|uniref:hypothetical protein n=1 Tax=Muribaculum intestinale TaxID=1796646 RepID=UPI0025B2879C|nr:hypothetical protein [Muribaculum intestinale]